MGTELNQTDSNVLTERTEDDINFNKIELTTGDREYKRKVANGELYCCFQCVAVAPVYLHYHFEEDPSEWNLWKCKIRIGEIGLAEFILEKGTKRIRNWCVSLLSLVKLRALKIDNAGFHEDESMIERLSKQFKLDASVNVKTGMN